jgi:hypothetical protein
MRSYVSASVAVFTLVAVLHLLRVVFDWPLNIGGYEVPRGWSFLGVVIAGTLAYWGFSLSRKS